MGAWMVWGGGCGGVAIGVCTTHTSMKMEPKGRTPSNMTIAHGSINQNSKQQQLTTCNCVVL